MLIAPEAFGATLGATQAAQAMARGWADGAPHDVLDLQPLSDGGPGFLDVLAPHVAGESIALTVSDPLGREVPAEMVLSEAHGTRTAYLETSQAIGLHLLAADERDPALTSSWGVGQLISAAIAEGAQRVVLGLGGDAVNDAGAGALSALGAGPAEDLARGGRALAQAHAASLSGLSGVIERLAGVELVIATLHDGPLLGLQGTSAVDSPDKGASPETAQALEAAVGHVVDLAQRMLPARIDLLTGARRRLDRAPGAGAAGGLGWALMLLGAHRVDAVAEVLHLVAFADRLRAHDLVLTGTGCLDWAALRGSVVAGVAQQALDVGVPSVAISGECPVGRRELMSIGLSGSYALAESPDEVAAVVADPVGHLRARTARVARTWSPGRP